MEKTEQTEKEKQIPIINYIPIIFIIVVIPLITRAKLIELSLEVANSWRGGTTNVDFFSYYKSTVLIIVTLIYLLSYMQLILKKKLTLSYERKYHLPIGVYAVFVIVSSFFSPYRNVAFLGFADIYQGMSVLLCYILLTFILMNFLQNERDIKIIIYSFAVLTIIVGLLGLGQYFGYDFFKTQIGKIIISPKEIPLEKLKFILVKHTIYATMYNTNFVGSFGAIVLPIMIMLYLKAYGGKKSVFFYVTSLLAYTTWLGCNSRAGYVGIVGAGIVGVTLFRNFIKEKSKKLAVLLVSYIIIAVIFNNVSGGRIFSQFSKLSPLKEAQKIEDALAAQKVRFEKVAIQDNIFTVKTTKEELKAETEGDIITFTDEHGKTLETITDNKGKIIFTDEKYKDYLFVKKENFPFITADMYGRKLNLYIAEGGELKVISHNLKLTVPVEAPRIKFFDGKETFASNRGYIWSRAIPMVKDTLLMGYGPDNFCMMFPQEDYVGRFNTGMGMLNIVIDKPHNMYLQTAINTGGISLMCLIIIWAAYLCDSIKLYRCNNLKTFEESMGAAIFLSVTAYLGAGMFNDNIVSVAPLFFIALGTGIGVNRIVSSFVDNQQIQC